MHYVHKKARCGPEIAIFKTKTLHFFRVVRLNWLEKTELRGARGTPGLQYCKLVKLSSAKNAKKKLKLKKQ